jgi:predicted thioesterase
MTVEEKDLSSVTGNIGAKVLSTHCLVLLVELASRSVVEKLLGEGQMVVGTWIGIRHLAAVPLGLKVRAESTLREIEGRKLIFDVVAYDPHEKIAEGSNELLIVSAEKFLDRVKRKM